VGIGVDLFEARLKFNCPGIALERAERGFRSRNVKNFKNRVLHFVSLTEKWSGCQGSLFGFPAGNKNSLAFQAQPLAAFRRCRNFKLGIGLELLVNIFLIAGAEAQLIIKFHNKSKRPYFGTGAINGGKVKC